jgi:hypothetical protein
MGVLKSPRLGLLRFWGAITLHVDLRLRWGLKVSCSLHQELFNGMLHVIYTHENRVDFWLLVVESQIVNLTFALLLAITCDQMSKWAIQAHFRYLSFKIFPLIEKTPQTIEFWPLQSPFENLGVHWDSNSPKWNSLRVWGFIPSHLLTLPGVCCVTPNFPLGLQPCKPLPWLRAQG